MSPDVPTKAPVYGSVHYLIAVVVLLACAVGVNATLNAIGFVMAKAEVPLKKSLEELPESFGGRFELARHINSGNEVINGKVQLTDDVVKTLGTEDFIMWIFQDRELSRPGAPVYVRLHLAYYTGILDATPHVPDTCMVAGGYAADRRYDRDVTWSAPAMDESWAHWREVEVRQSGFVSPQGGQQLVYYVFCANGQPRGRYGVRMMMSDPRIKYCYYLKVEIGAFAEPAPLTVDEVAEVSEAFWAAAAPVIFGHVMSAEELEQLEAGR